MEVYVARQPIFDTKKQIYAYELLFRDSLSNFFSETDGEVATSKVLSNSFLSIGMEKIIGSKLAFINFTQDLLVRKTPLMFPCETIVVEILENVEPEENVVTACREIANKGYGIALDDFFYKAELEPLVALANIIKIDFLATPLEEIIDIVKKLSEYGVKLLAEKVETYEEFKQALEMGFDYFQGYFFSKPEIIQGKDISGLQMNLLQIMAEMTKKDFEFTKIVEIVSRDVAISYKLLRYINSAYFGFTQRVSSINQAAILLGQKGIRRFLSLIAMARLAEDKPNELIRTSIIRARFCELLGDMSGSQINSSELFTVGLFSTIDAILDDSMENLMEKLPLSGNIKTALVHKQGELNDYLKLTVCYEIGDWQGVSETVGKLGLKEAEIPLQFIEAINWADSFPTLS